MSAGGSFNPSANPYPSGGPIDNQQGLQTSPNPSLPPADYSMGYARNFQPPSFFNPFSGYSGANTGMGGFQSQFGGFQQPQFGGFGGFGGFQQPQYGGFEQPQYAQYGGFQQPQYGGFQQPQYGGFQQQQFGGLGGFQQPFGGDYGGGFQQPFGGGFGGQSNRFTRRGQGYTQPYMPQPQPPQQQPFADVADNGRFDINRMVLTTAAPFDRPPPPPPPGMMRNPEYTDQDFVNAATFGGLQGSGRSQFIRDPSQPQPPSMFNMMGGFNPMMGGGIGAFGGFQQQFNPYGNAYAEPPQQAQRGTVDQNMSNPAFKRQQDAYNMTDYQRLMQRKDSAANAPPAPPMSGLVGLGGMPIRAPSDYEIAQSLGLGDSGITDMRAKMPEEYQREETTRQARAKSYLDSINYGQAGFDPSKYEVKREVQPSGFGSLFSGLGRG